MQLRRDHAEVTPPATTVNLGPAFGALGLALDLSDQISIRAVAGQSQVTVRDDTDPVPGRLQILSGVETEHHPTIRALRYILDRVGSPQIGIDLQYRKAVPTAVGLGDLEVQVLGGFLAARQLLGDPPEFDANTLARFALDFNLSLPRVGAILFGGLVLWSLDAQKLLAAGDEEIPLMDPRPLTFPVNKAIAPVIFVPDFTLTAEGRTEILPSSVSFPRFGANIARTAALLSLLTFADPASFGEAELGFAEWRSQLLAATADDVYLPHREAFAPASVALVRWLRERDQVAVLSGAGSAVLSLTKVPRSIVISAQKSGWKVQKLGVQSSGLFKGHVR